MGYKASMLVFCSLSSTGRKRKKQVKKKKSRVDITLKTRPTNYSDKRQASPTTRRQRERAYLGVSWGKEISKRRCWGAGQLREWRRLRRSYYREREKDAEEADKKRLQIYSTAYVPLPTPVLHSYNPAPTQKSGYTIST